MPPAGSSLARCDVASSSGDESKEKKQKKKQKKKKDFDDDDLQKNAVKKKKTDDDEEGSDPSDAPDDDKKEKKKKKTQKPKPKGPKKTKKKAGGGGKKKDRSYVPDSVRDPELAKMFEIAQEAEDANAVDLTSSSEEPCCPKDWQVSNITCSCEFSSWILQCTTDWLSSAPLTD